MMRYVASVVLVAAAMAGRAWGLEPATAQQERLEEIRSLLAGGRCVEAIEAARPSREIAGRPFYTGIQPPAFMAF